MTEHRNQEQCRECGSIKLVEDIREGSIYCQVCSLEHRSHMIDYRIEWQTVINKDFFKDQKYDLDHKLTKIIDRVEKLANKLKLTDQHILEKAREIIRRILNRKQQKSTRLQTIQAASLLYAIYLSAGDTNLAMRKIPKLKTVTQKEISRFFKILKEELKNERELMVNHEHPIVIYSRNYSEIHGLPPDWIELIVYIIKIVLSYLTYGHLENNNVSKTIRNWDGRSRTTIAATIVYFITRIPRYPDVKVRVTTNLERGCDMPRLVV